MPPFVCPKQETRSPRRPPPNHSTTSPLPNRTGRPSRGKNGCGGRLPAALRAEHVRGEQSRGRKALHALGQRRYGIDMATGVHDADDRAVVLVPDGSWLKNLRWKEFGALPGTTECFGEKSTAPRSNVCVRSLLPAPVAAVRAISCGFVQRFSVTNDATTLAVLGRGNECSRLQVESRL